MKRDIIYLITAMAALLAVVASCTDEIAPATIVTAATFTPKGNPVDCYLNLSVSGLRVTAGTKATDEDLEDSEAERTVNDLWVFQYDATSEELVIAPQYVSISSEDQSELASVPVRLSDNDGDASVIYVVTNTGSSTWAQYATTGGNYDDFITVAKLKAAAIPTPKPQWLKYDYEAKKYVSYDSEDADINLSIPMSGCSDAETITDGTTVYVEVQRMFAKLRIKVDLSQFNTDYSDVTVYNVTVGNIPEYCTVDAQGDEYDESVAGNYEGCTWLTRAFANNEESDDDNSGEGSDDETIYPYVIYVPENIQGGSVNENDTKALSVTVDINAINKEDGVTIGPYSFTAYPGSDKIDATTTERTNYNVKRNYIYNISMTIYDFEDVNQAIPSANCIICLSGETTTFYPYCREESGGGYYFSDYLDADYSTGDDSKRISTVEILWQSESTTGQDGGFIGNNSDGSLVKIDEAPNNALPDDAKSTAEYCRKIYVTIPKGETGNAVIAARNSDKEIVWSWHIWSRTREEDPGNEANGVLYYTYDWDSDGIKYDQPRIAGYTVMNCNLGALQNVPTGDNYKSYEAAIPTYGNFYQWGRKDPFPAVKKAALVSSSTTEVNDGANYCTQYVGNYYDNENEQVVINNEVTDDDPTVLFHYYEDPNNVEGFGINYSIQHPTIFMIWKGYNGNERNAWSRDAFYGYGYNKKYPTLWGASPDGTGTKHYDTPYVDGNYNIYIEDIYGTEKSIFDPCPYGWRVSPPDIWMGFTKNGLNPDSYDDVNYNPDKSDYSGFTMYMDGWRENATSTSYFPTQGAIHSDGKIYRVNVCGNYTNAIQDLHHYVCVTHFHNYNVGEFAVFSDVCRYTSLGAPVRCVRFGSVSN